MIKSKVSELMPSRRRTMCLALVLLTLIAIDIGRGSSLAAASEIPSFDRVRVLDAPRSFSDVELVDQNGESALLTDLHGRVAFVFFGFTNCPDVCPLAMVRFRQLYSSGLVDTDKVAFVMISVDGQRDTPQALKSFLAEYSSDFIGLTGDPAAVRPIAKQFSAYFFKGNESDGNYTVSHSPQAFVVDPSGRVRAELYSASTEAMAGVANALLVEHATASN